jgi:hypothetical protein
MGYDVHITRAEEWFESEANPISLDEWLAYVVNDSEMRHDGFAEATTSKGETLRIEADGLSVWTAYSGHGKNGNMAWFYWSDGQVQVKNPDDEILGKMRAIATQLGAHVIGDEGEHY